MVLKAADTAGTEPTFRAEAGGGSSSAVRCRDGLAELSKARKVGPFSNFACICETTVLVIQAEKQPLITLYFDTFGAAD
jgi:hypothetical protein